MESKGNKFSIKSRYRPEIDGLRAFAVIAVVINHFDKDILPGGYLGVDIFFVISGYVITSSLYQRPSKDFKDFISGFYERRIKRLVPALSFFVMIISISFCLFNSSPWTSLKTGMTSLFGLSNIYLFNQSTDYFAQSTELNIFTHTWSLGVEEQFYILFPLLVWFSGFGRQTKNGGRNLFLIVGVLTIASLIGFIYLYPTNQPAAYFLMPSRFWEMAAGCLLFIFLKKRASIAQNLEKLPPLLLMALIVGVMYLPISLAVISTISIVLLSLALIASLKEGTAAFTIFTNSKVVYIGLISYSIYLWHWGVLSISRWTIGIHWWSVPFQIMLILSLAIGSYRWIETPLRKGNWFGKRWKTLVVGGGVLVAVTGSILILGKPLKGLLYVGKQNILNKPINFKGEVTKRIAKQCHTSRKKKYDALLGANVITKQYLDNCISGSTLKPIVAFSGDSHSLSMFPISEVIASTSKFDVFSHSRDGCAFPPLPEPSDKDCYEVQSSVSKKMVEEMSKRDFGSVFIATSHLNAHFEYDNSNRLSKSNVDQKLEDFIIDSKKLADKLKVIGASLIVVAPLPQHPEFYPDLCSKQWFRPRFSLPSICQKTDRMFLENQRKHIVEKLELASNKNSNIYIFDPFEKFCDKKFCYVEKNNIFFYVDNDHLSKEGAILFSKDLLSLINNINSSKVENINDKK